MTAKIVLLLATCALPGLATPCLAQSVPTGGSVPQNGTASNQQPQDESADIVVTAQKREERVLDVPISVTVVNPAQLDRQNIQSIGELSRAVPSLTGTNPQQLAIRGVQTAGVTRSSESATSVVLDGVVLGRAAVNGLFDVARVEVLSGPQGMLFGKNASAGVVNIVTASPSFSERALIAHADVGSFGFHRERLTANVPLSDNAAIRVGVHNETNDTPVRNVYNDGDRNYRYNNGIRGRFLWEPTSALSLNLIADYEHSGDNGIVGGTYAIVDPATPLAATLASCGVVAGRRNVRNCATAFSTVIADTERYGVSGQIDYKFANDYVITSITANRWYRLADPDYAGPGVDSDLLNRNILNTNVSFTNYKSFSQELRIASPAGQTVEFVAGGFYSDTNSTDRVTQAGSLGLLPAGLQAGRRTTIQLNQRSIAAFGQATINVTDKLGLIAGGRYTDERLRVNVVTPGPAGIAALGFLYIPGFSNAFPNLDQTVVNQNFSWRLGAQYEISRRLTTYFTASRGFKGPAVNDQAVVAAGISPVIQPEFPMYYELGVKGSILNGRLLGTIALFHNKVDGFQTPIYIPPSSTIPVGVFAQGNASYIKARGVEVALSGKPTREITLNTGVIYNDSSYAPDFVVACSALQVTGVGGCSAARTTRPTEHLANSPVWRVVLGGEYAHKFVSGLSGFLQSDFVFESPTDFSNTPDVNTRRGSTYRLGGRIGVRDDRTGWGISIFGRNLLNTFYPTITADPLGGFNGGQGRSYTTAPTIDNRRTYGVSVDAKF